MMKLARYITELSIEQGFITKEQGSWLRYALEKRISHFIVAIPFFLLGLVISSFANTVVFYLSFCYIRAFSGGYHAKTVVGCLISSLFSVFIFYMFSLGF